MLKAAALAILAVPIIILSGLIATNGFTEGSGGVALIGLLFGLIVVVPFVGPPLLLLYLQARFARNGSWRGLSIVAVLATVIDVILLLFLVPEAVGSLAGGTDDGVVGSGLLLGLVVVLTLAAWRQLNVTRTAWRHRSAPSPPRTS